MKTTSAPEQVTETLRQLGSDLQQARRRRRITSEQLAERARISRTTLSKIEKGEGGVSIAHYACVLLELDFLPALESLADASNDRTGLDMDAERLPQRVRRSSR